MKRKVILMFILVMAFAGAAYGQLERSAIKSLQKQKWERARVQLRKILQKDSTSVVGHYVMAIYFFSSKNADFQLDSANRHIISSLHYYQQASIKQREKIKHFPLDSVMLAALMSRIDSAAFDYAKGVNSEDAFRHFLSYYKNAVQRHEAIVLRDEAAYRQAAKVNTYQSFLDFLVNYPDTELKDAATKEYNRLLYEDKTRTGRLESYEEFLKEYPTSPYRKETERNIFEIFTASGKEDRYLEFIEKYPSSPFAGRAKNIFYFLLQENDPEHIAEFLPGDSIANVRFIDRTYLVPFYTGRQFGFMDDIGHEIIKITADSIKKEYLCGNIKEDFIVTSDKVVARNGGVIFTGDVEHVTDLGYGFLEIESGECKAVIHKTGFAVGEGCIQNARLLNGKCIALQQNDRWSLRALSGRRLMPDDWDDITNINDVVIFKKDKKYKLGTINHIAGLSNNEGLKSQDTFDEIKPWMHDLIWARTGDYQGLLDLSLNIRLPFETHSLSPAFFGTISTSSVGKRIYNTKGEESGNFQDIKISGSSIAVSQAGRWRFFDPVYNRYASAAFDSVTFVGPFSVGYYADTLRVYFSPKNSVELKNGKLEFIPGKDSTSFLLVEAGDKKTVYDQKGQKLFTAIFDKIQYAGRDIFIVSKNDKKGLMLSNGKLLLPFEYDAVGSINNNAITLLKKLKFGLYDIVQHRQIKPQYDRNLNHYSEKLLISFKDGFSGFIDWENKPVSEFEFDEIRYWNDTTAMIKKNMQWMLYDIHKKKILVDKIKKYSVVSDTKDEKIFIVNLENEYGVISNKRGTILPFVYSGIKNLGSSDDPLYFAEKHVEEASIIVVVYYTKNGAFIRKQVYEEDDYERIYCPDN